MKLIVNTDGGARGNPGHASSAFLIKNADGKTLHTAAHYLGVATNNVAEYMAVLKALQYLEENCNGVTEIQFLLDSNLVVQQLNKNFKIKNADLKVFAESIWDILKTMPKTSFTYIPRAKNHEADALVNECLDRQAITRP